MLLDGKAMLIEASNLSKAAGRVQQKQHMHWTSFTV
jgi:hypothetical protein